VLCVRRALVWALGPHTEFPRAFQAGWPLRAPPSATVSLQALWSCARGLRPNAIPIKLCVQWRGLWPHLRPRVPSPPC
jgi:hypothetical protein